LPIKFWEQIQKQWWFENIFTNLCESGVALTFSANTKNGSSNAIKVSNSI
jgi:hypothetical protein